jgi:hypothetical protein
VLLASLLAAQPSEAQPSFPQQRLQRDFQERQLDLKLRQRGEGRQLLRQRDFHSRQLQELLIEEITPPRAPAVSEQQQQRAERAQELDLKLEDRIELEIEQRAEPPAEDRLRFPSGLDRP